MIVNKIATMYKSNEYWKMISTVSIHDVPFFSSGTGKEYFYHRRISVNKGGKGYKRNDREYSSIPEGNKFGDIPLGIA